MKPLLIVSSDTHVSPPMPDFRPYIEKDYLDEFDAFLLEYEQHGSRGNSDASSLMHRLDPEEVERWERNVIEPGRLEGGRDPAARRTQREIEGVAAEVLFPDFGRPFELVGSPSQARFLKRETSQEHREVGDRAYNRWLADFINDPLNQIAAMAPMSGWVDVENTLQELRWFHQRGFKGLVLPKFSPQRPLFHPDYEPIWAEIEELSLIVNSHLGFSGTADPSIDLTGAPHPGCSVRLYTPEQQFFCHNILSHLIWGGVLERHPSLRVVFTEQGSGWTIGALEDMDYAYEGSYLRRDLRDVLPLKPSEYFHRQCFLGASLFSRAEVAARHRIGLKKLMLGTDYPHHEGTILAGTAAYLRATLGAEQVPEQEARMMLGLNAAELFGFDMDKLLTEAERVGPLPSDVLRPADPEELSLFARGDLNKPITGLL